MKKIILTILVAASFAQAKSWQSGCTESSKAINEMEEKQEELTLDYSWVNYYVADCWSCQYLDIGLISKWEKGLNCKLNYTTGNKK